MHSCWPIATRKPSLLLGRQLTLVVRSGRSSRSTCSSTFVTRGGRSKSPRGSSPYPCALRCQGVKKVGPVPKLTPWGGGRTSWHVLGVQHSKVLLLLLVWSCLLLRLLLIWSDLLLLLLVLVGRSDSGGRWGLSMWRSSCGCRRLPIPRLLCLGCSAGVVRQAMHRLTIPALAGATPNGTWRGACGDRRCGSNGATLLAPVPCIDNRNQVSGIRYQESH